MKGRKKNFFLFIGIKEKFFFMYICIYFLYFEWYTINIRGYPSKDQYHRLVFLDLWHIYSFEGLGSDFYL